MKTKYISYGLLAATLLLSTNGFAKNISKDIEMVVIQNSLGTKYIINGNYDKALKKFKGIKASRISNFELSMGLCVANYKVSKLETAEKNCTAAINAYESKSGISYRFLKSLAYSNRSIVRFKKGDIDGAFADINLAVEIDNNNIVHKNLNLLFPNKIEEIIELSQMDEE
jgi:tetratricopeptide (TPR) repeat protein